MKSYAEVIFERNAERLDAVAIVDKNGRRQTTWRQLTDMADKVTAYALAEGLCGVVPVLMPVSAETVAVYLGLNRAGVGIVPLHEKTPRGRCDTICEVVGNALFTVQDFEVSQTVTTDGSFGACKVTDPAIVVFTSGSTGTPKGVEIGNDAVKANLERLSGASFFDYQKGETVMQTSSLAFVAFLSDLLSPLYAGAVVHLLPEEARKDAVLMTDYVNKHRIVRFFTPPKVLALLGEMPSVKMICVGGERLIDFEPKGYRLVNAYGLSETVGQVFAFEVTQSHHNTPIGKPVGGFVCYLLDENGKPCDEGEVYLGGPMASGYFKRPDLTAEAFVKNPFADEDGHPVLLRTGDIARRLPDGNLSFINRRDFMLKINGQRVEPGETEAILRSVTGLDCAVVGVTEESGRSYLCAYYVSPCEIDEEETQKKLSEKLTSYLLPSYYIRLDKMPLNANGKVDVQRLKSPKLAAYQSEYEAPVGSLETTLCHVFESVLHVSRVGVNDDFIRLGGSSITAMEIVHGASPLPLTAQDVLMGKTPRKIAHAVESKQCEETVVFRDDLPEANLTDSQMGVYLQCMLNPDSVMYNIPVHFSFERKPTWNEDYVRTAVNTVVATHGALYACLDTSEEQIKMKRCPFPREGVCTVETVERFDGNFTDLVAPFDLFHGPFCRARVILTPNTAEVFFDCHHIVADGTSLSLMARQLAGVLGGSEPFLETLDAFAVYDRINASVTPEKTETAKLYFEKLLAGTETDSNLLFDRTPGEKAPYPIGYADGRIHLPKLNALLARAGLTESSFFMGAFGYALAKMTGQNASLFAFAENGRGTGVSENTVSMFVRTLPLLVTLDEEKNAVDFLREVQDEAFETLKNDCVSFGDLAREYGVSSSIMFAYQSELLSDFDSVVGHVSVENVPRAEGFTNLALTVNKRGEDYCLNLEYRKDAYRQETAMRFVDLYLNVLSAFAENAILKTIPLVSEGDLSILEKNNVTASPYAEEETFLDAFARAVNTHKEKTALVCRDERLTYGSLNTLSDAVASYVQSLGIGRGQTVAVLLPRCASMVTVSIGILKAGATYQPLDPTYPSERLCFMVKDADAKLLIADRTLLPMLADYDGAVLCIDEIDALPKNKPTAVKPTPDDVFVLLYTSGTTGQPKGCRVTHRNVSAYLHAYCTLLDENENSVHAAYASYGFDAHLSELYPALSVGGTLHIVPEELRLDLPALKEYFEANGVTHTVMTTQIARQFVAEYPHVQSLRHILAGGEKLGAVTPPESYCLTNGYGPTEATVMVTCFTLDRRYEDTPIGKALPNVKLVTADAYGRRLPIGVPGELIVFGPQVSAGYLNRPEKTAEVFVPNVYEKNPLPTYATGYMTGDICRILDDGVLEIIGRRDLQVKIRGFRIEPAEIEAVMREYPGVTDAVVIAVDAPSGGKCLHAYVVSGETVDIADLHHFIAERKPPYMVPAATLQIDAIPLTPNFKVDKRKLPPIVSSQPKTGIQTSERKRTDLENRLFDLVRDIVGHGDFDVETDFVSAGVTSISSIRLAVAVYKQFGLHMTSKDVLDGGSILSVENAIVSAYIKGREGEEQVRPVKSSYPLTQSQLGVYLDCLRSGNDTYNVPFLIELDAKIDTEKLKEALAGALSAHPSLAVYIDTDEEGNPHAYPVSDMPFACSEETCAPDAVTPTHFTFGKNPLFRFRILRHDGKKYLLTEMHHIVADGESVRIFLEDVERAYDGERIEAETYTSFAVSEEEQTARAGKDFAVAKTYYDSVFRGVSSDYLPSADKNEATTLAEFGSPCATLQNAVETLCRENGVSEAVFFTSAFALTLSRFTAHDDALFATIHNGRGDPRSERLVSMLVKTLPFYIGVGADTSVKDLLTAVDDRQKQLKKYDVYAFADAARDFGVSANPMFIYQGDLLAHCPLGTMVKTASSGNGTKSELTLEVNRTDGGYALLVTYNGGRYSPEFVRGFADAFDTCVKEMLTAKKVGDVDICSDIARAQFADFNDTDVDIPYRPAYRLIEERAERHPDRIAVVSGERKLTYRQLDGMTNRLAEALCELGIPEGSAVEVITDRTADVYLAQIGILKSANAFLFLSPDYPDERIVFITADASAKAIVTTRAVAERRGDLFLRLGLPVLYTDDIDENADTPSLNLSVEPRALAYMIYTSGSTGKPKGVTVTQLGLVTQATPTEKNREYDGYAREGAVSAATSAFTFDASIADGVIALANGATVCIADEHQIHNPDAFCEMCLKNGVNLLLGTPSFMMNLTDYEGFAEVGKRLRSITCGGEEFPQALLERLSVLCPNAHIINGYGPSEATVSCSYKYLQPGKPITIGRPLSNTKLYCLDAFNRILPMGALGELAVLGDIVGNGYLNREDLNRRAFITVMDKPTFKTGDLAVISHDGEVHFHGRIDSQVKIRGLRIELGEIEHVMGEVPGMKNTVVVVRGEGENKYLSAYYTAERPISTDEVTTAVSQKLASYMVPHVMMQLDAFPMTANGKIDRKALPEITAEKVREGATAVTETEKKICELYCTVLKTKDVFLDDDFFAIGGNSLAASRVVMQLKSMGYAVEYQTIFNYPTVRALADFLGDTGEKKAETVDYEGDPTETSLREVLASNVPACADRVTRTPLGDVLLTGAVGFLGIHVLRELLEGETGHVYCLVRKGRYPAPEKRLDAISFYYYGRCLREDYPDRVTVIDADITSENLSALFKNVTFDTAINCAASVKHYASDNSISFVNVNGVQNMIALAREKNARFVQISTTSVPGVHTEESYRHGVVLHENQLFMCDDMDNQYIISKNTAEHCVLEAVKNGLKGKIIRVGNLMGRHLDGEFQINMKSNAFLNALKGFTVIGKCPISHGTDPMEFSPVDCTARAIVLLAGTDDCFTVFHANSRYIVDEMQLIDSANRCGLPIIPTDDKAYYETYNRMLGDDKVNKYLGGLVTNDRPDLHSIKVDNSFTAGVLYRLGFSWPVIDGSYLDRMLSGLKAIGFFDTDEV